MHTLVRKSLVVVAAFALQAAAQNRVCIGGNLDQLTKAEKASCWTSANRVRSLTARFSAPADWHFFVVCSASDWHDYAAYSTRSAQDLESMAADTNLSAHTTFFRGDWLMQADATTVNSLVAHEVASATMKTTDPRLIRRMVALWLPEEGVKPVTLAAAE